MIRQFANKLRPILRLHSPGQPRPIQIVGRQRLRLFVIDALQQILQTT